MQLVKCLLCGEVYDLHSVSVASHEIGEIKFITPCCNKTASDAKADFEYIVNIDAVKTSVDKIAVQQNTHAGMDKVRLFLKAAVGENEKEIESYIKHDHWVEFPTRALGAILAKYEAAQQGGEATGWWTCKNCGEINIDEYQKCVECESPRA